MRHISIEKLNRNLVYIMIALFCHGCGVSYQGVSLPKVPIKSGWEIIENCYNVNCTNPIYAIKNQSGFELEIKSHNKEIKKALMLYPFPAQLSSSDPKEIGSKYYAISIRIKTEDSCSIDFSKIFLFLSDRKISPEGYIVRSDKQQNVAPNIEQHEMTCLNCMEVDYYSNEEIDYNTVNNQALKAMSGDCFDIIFDIPPPNPEKDFELAIEGLYSEGKKITIPIISFKKGNARPGL